MILQKSDPVIQDIYRAIEANALLKPSLQYFIRTHTNIKIKSVTTKDELITILLEMLDNLSKYNIPKKEWKDLFDTAVESRLINSAKKTAKKSPKKATEKSKKTARKKPGFFDLTHYYYKKGDAGGFLDMTMDYYNKLFSNTSPKKSEKKTPKKSPKRAKIMLPKQLTPGPLPKQVKVDEERQPIQISGNFTKYKLEIQRKSPSKLHESLAHKNRQQLLILAEIFTVPTFNGTRSNEQLIKYIQIHLH